jgi:hypothetical protein
VERIIHRADSRLDLTDVGERDRPRKPVQVGQRCTADVFTCLSHNAVIGRTINERPARDSLPAAQLIMQHHVARHHLRDERSGSPGVAFSRVYAREQVRPDVVAISEPFRAMA